LQVLENLAPVRPDPFEDIPTDFFVSHDDSSAVIALSSAACNFVYTTRLVTPGQVMDEQLLSLYHRNVAMAFDRQLRLAEFLQRKAPKERPKYDITTATLAFGKVTFEAPVLGSRQEHNNSWLWAWSDRNLKLTITNRALGDAVRVLVHRLG